MKILNQNTQQTNSTRTQPSELNPKRSRSFISTQAIPMLLLISGISTEYALRMILFILSLALAACGDDDVPVPSGNPTGSISGMVSDDTGSPIEEAVVRIIPTNKQTSTDIEGRYQITALTPGNYQVLGEKPGYISDTVTVTVVADQEANADLTLTKETKSFINLIGEDGLLSRTISLNLGYNVWFSELDCGNFDVYAHGLYLSSDISMAAYGDDVTGRSLLPSGKGHRVMFNLYSKFSSLVEGTYTFVDEVDCNGNVTDAGSSFIMSSRDLLVTAVSEVDEPTSYVLDADLSDIDWTTERLNPSSETVAKATAYQNSRIRIKKGSVTVERIDEEYHIIIDCVDENNIRLQGEYIGELERIEFGV